MQGKAVESEYVSTCPVGEDHPRDREDDSFRETHSLVSSSGLAASESGEGGEIGFVGGAVTV